MRVKRSILVAALLFLGMVSVAQSQETYVIRKFGLTASIQGGQPAILIPLWLGDTMILAPGIQINYLENVRSDFALFLAPRFYMDMKRVAPYIAAQVGVMFNRPDVGAKTQNLLLAAGFGGEYFVNPKFSFGIEALLVGSVFDLSGANVIGIATAMAVHANVYF